MMYNVAAPKIFELDFSKSKICMDYTPESRGQIQRAESWIKKIAMAVPVVVLASAALRVDNIEQISIDLTMIDVVKTVAILGTLYLARRCILNRIENGSRTKGELAEIYRSVPRSYSDELGRKQFRDLDKKRNEDEMRRPAEFCQLSDSLRRRDLSLAIPTETNHALAKLMEKLVQLPDLFANAEQSQSLYLGKELCGEIDRFKEFFEKIKPRLKECDDVRKAVVTLLWGKESIEEISEDLKFSVEELRGWKEFIEKERGLCKFDELNETALSQKLWEISYSIINDRKVKFPEVTFEENKSK